jgi:hypothetical protein
MTRQIPLTPEIMEDVAKWIFLAVTGMAGADSLIDSNTNNSLTTLKIFIMLMVDGRP